MAAARADSTGKTVRPVGYQGGFEDFPAALGTKETHPGHNNLLLVTDINQDTTGQSKSKSGGENRRLLLSGIC